MLRPMTASLSCCCCSRSPSSRRFTATISSTTTISGTSSRIRSSRWDSDTRRSRESGWSRTTPTGSRSRRSRTSSTMRCATRRRRSGWRSRRCGKPTPEFPDISTRSPREIRARAEEYARGRARGGAR